MLGQLQDAGNTTTLAHYLRLLETAFLASGLELFSRGSVRKRGSSPKLLLWNNALGDRGEMREERQDPGPGSVSCPVSGNAASRRWRERHPPAGVFRHTRRVVAGITSCNTAKAWISVLEASYIVFQLRPHHANFNKRLVKAPKLYFYDTGLVSWLLGIQTPQQLETHPLRGNIFETFVVAELMKSRLNRGERPNLSFWRDSNGNEVDVIIEEGERLVPVEIKSGKTVARDFFLGLKKWTALAGALSFHPTLVYGGEDSYQHKKVSVVGWKDAAKLPKTLEPGRSCELPLNRDRREPIAPDELCSSCAKAPFRGFSRLCAPSCPSSVLRDFICLRALI